MAFDTYLSDENKLRFNNWVQQQSQTRGRDLNQDMQDYDLQGYWLNGGYKDTGTSHMPDTYKKPNHPTFSNESIYHDGKNYAGGTWGDGTFTPGRTNLQYHGIENLKNYFQKYEPDTELNY